MSIKSNIEIDEQPLFTNDEIFTRDTPWSVYGFITDEQIFHFVSGRGIVCDEKYQNDVDFDVDFDLINIESGHVYDYKGMSGSPVIYNDYIVGILQIQNYKDRNLPELKMSSTALILGIVPPQLICESKYVEEFRCLSKNFTMGLIEKNKQNKKYIPEIFVEEGFYKENLRYFSEPKLFIKKAVEEISSFDLMPVNKFLINKKEKKLDFTDIVKFASEHSTFEVCDLLEQRLDVAIKAIEKARNKLEDSGISREKIYLKEDGSSIGILYSLESIRNEIRFFKYKIVLITNGAGQGKTNFLCDFTYNFLLKKRFLVLFYNAYDLRESIINLIKRELTIDKKYSWEYVKQALSKKWMCEQQAVIIIIDGLNENTDINFKVHLTQFLKETQKLPFMKVILSTRNELLKERFGFLSSAEFGKDFYHIDMKQRSDTFEERIFWGYLDYFKIEISKNTLLLKTYKQLAQDTLLLRFFCEVNQGKKQIRMLNIHKYSLFSKYYEMKKEESVKEESYGTDGIFDKLINHICQIMIDQRRFSKIPRDELLEVELVLIDKIIESDIIFKQEAQIKRGFLEEQEDILSFTFDEFRDYCITKYILRNYCNENDFSQIWSVMHCEKWTIVEGVERYIFFLARTESKEVLSFLKKEEGYNQLYWKNVLDLEDADVTSDDVLTWKKEILSRGEYAAAVGRYLIVRTDRKYFKNANIDLLFEALNDLAENPVVFEEVAWNFFRKRKVNKQALILTNKGTVFPCDDLISYFEDHRTTIKITSEKEDYLMLSIYMISIDFHSVEKLWGDIYLESPEYIEAILKKCVIKDKFPQLIYSKIKLIIDGLIKKVACNTELKKLGVLLDKNLKQDDYKKINEKFSSIWDV